MTLKDVKYFSTLPDKAISIYEKAYSEKLNIDDDNWQEAKEAAEKAILGSKYKDLYVDAMLLYLGEKAKEIEQLRIGKDYPGI